ncbi:MAG: 6-phosphogluconate dehydrogenase NAD-binding [Spartobacteria bacterium]|nr:6-phosphogluconate dehydrogenase NAD-binding [Spartobacteria bacterium]
MCDFVQIFVSDDDALLHVTKQLSPGLAARHVVIAHSTVSPQTILAAAEIVERRGARFLEAPFTGSRDAAEKGDLVYYVGGDSAVLEEARPVLEASSKQILEIGEIGQATAIKVATNMVTAASVQSAAEALALVQAAGLPLEKFALAMQQNASNSNTLSMKLPKMIEGNFERHFSVQHMLKDMQIASRLGLSHHLELAVSSAARDRLLEQVQRGHGDDDYSAVARKYFQDTEERTETELELFKAAASAPAVKEEVPQPINPAPEISLEDTRLRPEESGLSQDPILQSAVANPSLLEHAEHAKGNGESAALELSSSFLPEPIEQAHAEGPDEPRGFFSRLLRRPGNY